VLVVGATGGLGAPISRRLAAQGAKLTLLGRDAGRVAALGLDATVIAGDLMDPHTPERAVESAVSAYGGLDGLVIATGVVAFGAIGDMPDEALVNLFLVNTIAPIRILQAALPHLLASAERGRQPFVVTLSAVVAEQPTAGMAAYSATKAALTAYDAAAGRELRRARVRLIDARPPHTETGLADRPIVGSPPRLPEGKDPDVVAARILAAIVNDETDLPSSAFA